MSTNPFDEDTTEDDHRRQSISGGDSDARKTPIATFDIGGNDVQKPNVSISFNYDSMAKRLLEDNFILTALEFHAELLESGKELRRLRDYFSNPTHFEFISSNRPELLPSTLPRTSSAQTLDSLDFARYSDDGDRQADDRVAVLEFELRKARDTIQSLRERLTIASETRGLTRDNESNDTLTHITGTITSGIDSRRNVSYIPLKPHEKRALNFLIHEFLLQNEHKLTAVTFSDEVDDQDFEDWDDVGLNVPRPPDLRAMYRDFCFRTPGYVQRKDACCYVNMNTDARFSEPYDHNEMDLLNKLNEENATLMERNQYLEAEMERLSSQIRQLQKELSSNAQNLSNAIPIRSVNADQPISDSRSTTGAPLKPEKDELKRNVPQQLKEKVLSTMAKSSTIQRQKSNELIRVAKSNEELVHILSFSLPRIIPNVLLNKREELISPILALASIHPDAKTRDQLLNAYFGLMKRPDDEQRQLLVAGCIAYVKAVGALRTETELLPQCWEQMSHKHVERRLLIAETCGLIIPYLPPSISGSLILSMLQQMLTEDKSELVREAVVRSLAVLCNYIEDKDKFGQLTDLMQKSLNDQCEHVVGVAKASLVPCLGFWALELNQLQTAVVGLFVKRISQLILTSGVNQASNEQLLCTYFACLRNLTTLSFWYVLRSGPYFSNGTDGQNADDSSTELESTRFSNSDGLLDDLAILLDDRERTAYVVAAYDEYTSREWYETWDQFDYVVKEMLPQLIAALGKLDPNLGKVIHISVDYFRHFLKVFGRGLSVTKIRPLFSALIKLPSELNDKYDSACPIAYAVLPVYVAGILGAHFTENDKKELKSFLKTAVVTVAQSNISQNSILASFCELSISYPDSELMLSVVWDLITHKSAHVRRLCASVLCRLVRSMNDESCLRNKLVPALITLASDREPYVKASTLAGFGAALELSTAHGDITEKIRMQLCSMLEESPNVDVVIQILRMFAQVAPNLDAKFRDEFVLQQLTLVCARNNASANMDSKAMIAAALFDAYSALSCCYLTQNAIAESFLPGLKGLLKDLDVERQKIAKSIIKDLENKILLTNPIDKKSSVLGPTEMAVDEMKIKMMSKFRDLKDKMDQHKENVPNLFKKK